MTVSSYRLYLLCASIPGDLQAIAYWFQFWLVYRPDITSLFTMSQRPVYSSFNIPTVITHPSVRCLQWSDDAQLCFVTKSAVHILVRISGVYESSRVKCMQTPDHGINFSTPSDIRSPVRDESDRPLGWYRTMIEMTRAQTHSWPSISQGRTLYLCSSSYSFVSRLGVPGLGFPRYLCSCYSVFPE